MNYGTWHADVAQDMGTPQIVAIPLCAIESVTNTKLLQGGLDVVHLSVRGAGGRILDLQLSPACLGSAAHSTHGSAVRR